MSVNVASRQMIANPNQVEARSDLLARSRFARPEVAARYPDTYRPTGRDRHELRCLRQALAGVAAGAMVLDLPCGSGRLTNLLVERGYQVLAADSSPGMVARARQNWLAHAQAIGEDSARVTHWVCDVMASGLSTDGVDAIVCNRLLHHFTEPATRQQALGELRRLTAGPIVVSFFNRFALDAAKFRLKHWARGTTPSDRIPIALAQFRADAAAAGLSITRLLATRWGISPQWYAVLRRR